MGLDEDCLRSGRAVVLTDTATNATTLDNHGGAGADKANRTFPDRAAIDAERTILSVTSNASLRVDFGESHSNRARIGKGQERAAGADVGAQQSVTDHAGGLVRIDRGCSCAPAM